MLHSQVEWSPLAPPAVEDMMHSLAWAREKIASMREDNLRLRRVNKKLRDKLHEAEGLAELGEAVEEFITEFARRLKPIQLQVANFASEHAEAVERVLLTLADDRLYFLFMLRKSEFDWDLSDELGDLQTSIIIEHQDMPVACSAVPGGYDNERYLSACRLSELLVHRDEAAAAQG